MCLARVQVVQYGNAVRSTGVSGVNPHSSRSHAILQLEVRDGKDAKQGRCALSDVIKKLIVLIGDFFSWNNTLHKTTHRHS